ncbi:MAG: TAXI family TRAP transporter solute-binding subunit, partial [Sulfolobales archaeon]
VLVEIPDDAINAFTQKFPGLATKGVIPKNVYGTDKDVQTLTFWNMFVCHKDMPDELAYQITKTVFEHLDILQKSVAAAKDTTLKNALLY